MDFEDTNQRLEELNLGVYAPTNYIKPEYIDYYRQKYEKKRGDGRVFITMTVQERGIKILHRFNLFKRLESSVYSFGQTIKRLLDRIDSYIGVLESKLD